MIVDTVVVVAVKEAAAFLHSVETPPREGAKNLAVSSYRGEPGEAGREREFRFWVWRVFLSDFD